MAVGDPTGDDLCVGTTDGNTLPVQPEYEEREITLGDGYALESGTQYAIVLRNLDADINSAITITGEIFPDADYADGLYVDSDDGGETWSQDDWIDIWFKTKAEAVEKDTYTDTVWANRNVYGDSWFAQTFTAGSTYTITSVVLRLGREDGGTPGVVTVSIKATEWSPGNPIPAHEATGVDWSDLTLDWTDTVDG